LRHVRERVAAKVAIADAVAVDVLVAAVHVRVVATKVDGRDVLGVKLLVLLVEQLGEKPIAYLEVRVVDERLEVQREFGVLQVSGVHLAGSVQV